MVAKISTTANNQIPPTHRILAIVLAGGAGTRFAGKDKGLQLYQGKPLVQSVIEVVVPQVDDLIISANRNQTRYHDFGFPVVADSSSGYEGPIAGIFAALNSLTPPNNYDYVLICPCDSPSLPSDYVSKLLFQLNETNSLSALVFDGKRKQNLHCLIKHTAWQALIDFYKEGGRAMHRWHKSVDAVEVNFSKHSNVFSNINLPEQLL